MKVGILTFYKNYNYGSSLQSYALTRYINSLGIDAYLIDFTDKKNTINKQIHKKTNRNRIITALKHPYVFFNMLRGKMVAMKSVKRNQKVIELYDSFEREHQKVFSGDYTEGFDYFITGSDQVWKIDVPGLSCVFFQRFANKNQRIAYAVSLGTEEIPRFNSVQFEKYVKDFTTVSVREQLNKKMLNDRGIDCEWVLDPVLLVGRTFWEEKIGERIFEHEYVVCYFLDSFEKNYDYIVNYAKKNNKKIIVVDSGVECEYLPNYELVQVAPFEFLNYLNYSDCVFTDSFHGTAFSILFHKKFIVFPREYKVYKGQSIRIESLLEFTGLNECFFDGGKHQTSPNYELVDDKIEKMREKSVLFLKNALKIGE